jgi:hypothetical protein
MPVRGARLALGAELGGYRIDGLIGQGAMGMVYRVTQYRTEPDLRAQGADSRGEQFRRRFPREMQVAASLEHTNVVGVRYAGERDGVLFLTMNPVGAASWAWRGRGAQHRRCVSRARCEPAWDSRRVLNNRKRSRFSPGRATNGVTYDRPDQCRNVLRPNRRYRSCWIDRRAVLR